MKRKQALRASVAMCQKITLSIAAFLLIFGAVFSVHYVQAEGEEAPSDTPSEVREPETTDSSETTTSDSSETFLFEVESDDTDVELEVIEVDITSDETEDEGEDTTSTVSADFSSEELLDEPIEDVFKMFSSFTPLLVTSIVATSSAAIITPSAGDDISGVYTFTAEYDNPLFMGPYGVRWAIRADGLCSGDTPAVPVFGNVDGATTSPDHTAGAFGMYTSGDNTVDWDGESFTAVLDFSELPEGEYCFAFNPNPANSHRQTVLFNHVIPTTGSIVITKDVLGTDEESFDETSFSVMLGMEEAFTNVSEVSNGVFSDLPEGEYVIREIDAEMYDFVSMTSGTTTVYENEITVQVTAGATTTVHIVNEPVEEECSECGPTVGTLVINKNVINKDGDDISDDTVFDVTITPYGMETRSIPLDVTISEDAPASEELYEGSYRVCEELEEGSDYELVIDDGFDMESEFPSNCRIIEMSEEDVSITFTNRKLTEEESESRSGSRRHPVGGSVLGAFTGSNGGSCGMYITTYMKIGQANDVEEVKKLQAFLNEQGFAVPVTGFFGELTDAAVKRFQAKFSTEILTPWGSDTDATGYVYKMTRYFINNMICQGSEAKPVL